MWNTGIKNCWIELSVKEIWEMINWSRKCVKQIKVLMINMGLDTLNLIN